MKENPCAKLLIKYGSGMNKRQRFYVVPKSVSAHCCFSATVMDRETGESVCETFSKKDAQSIVNALNNYNLE